MKNQIYLFKPLLLLVALLLNAIPAFNQELRAPAYPLITHNPYLSVWSMGDKLNESPTKHWTGTEHSLLGLVKVDGEVYRFLGKESKQYKNIVPASDESEYTVRYTEEKPAGEWSKNDFNDSKWRTGKAPFSDDRTQAATLWESDNLWVRRSFTLKKIPSQKLYLKIRHDDNVKVYLNGEIIYDFEGWIHRYKYVPIDDAIVKKLGKGENTLAIHCANTAGGAWLDAGLVTEEDIDGQAKILTAEQTDVTLNATQTIYQFRCGKVDVTATFTSPLLMDDLNVFSRPVTYLSVRAKSNDSKSHEVQLYLGVSGLMAVNSPGQKLVGEEYAYNKLSILKAGTEEQPVLEKKGDDLRIDWGYLYVASPSSPAVDQFLSPTKEALTPFLTAKNPPVVKEQESLDMMLNTIVDLEMIGSDEKEHLFMIGYDEVYSVQYFDARLRPWWNKDGGKKFESQLEEAYNDYNSISKKCEDFDSKLYADAREAGGEKYADLCALAYRQAIAAHTLVESPQGEILFLSKENHSNGSINTVDVTYPSAPLFLIYNPDLLKGMLNGIFYYSESGRWKKPFPAHDLGTYPIATGQTYGEDMPVEEAGNMLILTAAIAAAEGNAAYTKKHWEVLTEWAEYLSKSGFDPANQLSTDDFAGHLARNANLSVKAIMALAAYGKLAGMLGKPDVEKEYVASAREMAQKWMKLADDGDHYSLAFENKNTWSQKYNLVWDEILGLHVFPDMVEEKEISFYLTKQKKYGLPLDSRKTYTKSDWVVWTATLAEDEADFEALVAPIWDYANETPDRVPISDWHETTNAEVMNFKARSVVGGYFIKLLEERLKTANLN